MDIIQKRFDELEELGRAVDESKGYDDLVDARLYVRWRTSVLSLLTRAFGRNDPTCKDFARRVAEVAQGALTHRGFQGMWSVFLAAKQEFEGGYLFDLRKMVHAEIFSDELEQAAHFLQLGHKVAAAVTAGVVLETTLRNLCDRHDELEPADNLNRMNDDLAKASVYNKMRADQVRAWAKVRNSAAHGHPEEFDEGDVERMIDGVRDFVAAQLS